MNQVSIIIVNYQGVRFMDNCLKAILNQTYKNLEIIIVDNGSTDGSKQLIKNKYPDLILIENTKNLGFCRGNNQGFQMAHGRFLMPLNNDAILTHKYIEYLVSAIKENHKTGIVTGKILFFDKINDRNIINSTGHIIKKNRMPLDRGRGELDINQYNIKEPVFGATAVAPLYSREMLEDIRINNEYFDESYFSYFEDVDLSWRSRLLGWECIYVPQAVAYHYGGGTHLSKDRIMETHLYKNRYLLILKNDYFINFIKDIFHIFEKEIRLFIRAIMSPRRLLKVYLRLIFLLPEILKKRKVLMRKRKVSAKEIRKWLQ